MKRMSVLILVLLVAVAPSGFALSSVCSGEKPADYASAAVSALARGIYNAGFGWTELFRRPYLAEDKVDGAAKGLGGAIGRTVHGGFEAVTALIPKLDMPAINPRCPFQPYE